MAFAILFKILSAHCVWEWNKYVQQFHPNIWKPLNFLLQCLYSTVFLDQYCTLFWTEKNWIHCDFSGKWRIWNLWIEFRKYFQFDFYFQMSKYTFYKIQMWKLIQEGKKCHLWQKMFWKGASNIANIEQFLHLFSKGARMTKANNIIMHSKRFIAFSVW